MISLVAKGLTREEAYTIVQRNALDAFQNDGNFKLNLEKDPEVTSLLTQQEIENIFDKQTFLQNIDGIYDRVLG